LIKINDNGSLRTSSRSRPSTTGSSPANDASDAMCTVPWMLMSAVIAETVTAAPWLTR